MHHLDMPSLKFASTKGVPGSAPGGKLHGAVLLEVLVHVECIEEEVRFVS